MRHVVGVLVCLALGASGCAKDGGGAGFESPEAAARAMAEGFTKKDEKMGERLLPPEELLKKHFDCPEDQLVKARQKRLGQWPAELAKAPAGMTMEVGAIDAEKSTTETLAVGAEHNGCKVKEAVTVHALKLTLKITAEGKTKDDGETWRFVKFGDAERWYNFKL